MTDSAVRMWFVSDIHASNSCFRKFLNLAEHSARPNVLIIGGDITGKYIVPIVHHGGGRYTLEKAEGSETVPKAKIGEIKNSLEEVGAYVYECNINEFKQFKLSETRHNIVFEQLARKRLEEWVELADTKLENSDVMVFINAGNDDPLWVDEILDRSKKLIRPEGRVVDLPGGMKLLSTGYSNISPWKCPRDEEEIALMDRIVSMIDSMSPEDVRRTIFNLHCPPKNTHLDIAPELEKDYRKRAGLNGTAMAHVGSTAVREVIEEFQPAAALHGHIHTSEGSDIIGNTLCFNPGSDYASGTLKGVFLIFDTSGKLVFHQLTNERSSIPRKSGEKNWFERILSDFGLFKNAETHLGRPGREGRDEQGTNRNG